MGAFAVPFRVLSQKHMTGAGHKRKYVVLELVPHYGGEKKCKPRPQNRILVPLRFLFKISDELFSPLFYRGDPGKSAKQLFKLL